MYLVEKNHRVDRFTKKNYYHKISKYSYSFPSNTSVRT